MVALFIGIVVWLALAFAVGSMGAKREIGGPAAGALSFLLSPVIGLLFVLCSKFKEEENTVKKAELSAEKMATAIDSLKKGKELMQEGLIDQAAFERLKAQCEQVLHGLDNKEPEETNEQVLTAKVIENPDNYLTPKEVNKNIIMFLIITIVITVFIIALAYLSTAS